MLSAVVLTKNEKKNIERCLKSLDFVDEIVVVDDYSSDRTLSLIKNEKIKIKNLPSESEGDNSKLKIFKRSLNGDFAAQRNFGLEKASGEWILFLDADEEVSPDLKEEIKEVIRYASLERDDLVGFYIKRRDFFWGREVKFGEVLKVRQKGILRLIKKGFGQWQGKVHEKFKIENRKLKIGKLKNFINHYPHPTIKEFLQEINFYSSLRANELFSQGKKTNILEIIFYPLFKFILNYFIYLGFLDGPPGFVYAFMMSFHSFLVRGKLYIKNYTNDTNKKRDK
jgi:glycosyltransferase involved in cell wall biosynthesis